MPVNSSTVPGTEHRRHEWLLLLSHETISIATTASHLPGNLLMQNAAKNSYEASF